VTITSSPEPISDVYLPHLDDATVAQLHLSPIRVLKSEWIKFRSLRSSWLMVLIAVGALAALGVAICWSTAADWVHESARQRFHHFNPLADSLAGFELAQLAVGVLGVLVVAGEYSTGMIRASLGAVPKRLPVLWSKTLVVATITLITTLPAALIAFFGGQRMLATQHIQTTWSAPNVPRTVIGIALYLTVVSILGVGLGVLIRNVAGAIATFVGIMLILPVIASALPPTWADRINRFLPSTAGQSLLGFGSETRAMLPWNGFALFCVYALGTVMAGAILLKRRDA
jgi:ABC-2 type transport system permease protein